MTTDEELASILKVGETRNTEFKRVLTKADLRIDRLRKLVTRIRYMTCESPFEGRFLIGIEDIGGKEWKLYGLTERSLQAAEEVLTEICQEAETAIVEKERIQTTKGLIGVYLLSRIEAIEVKETCSINVAGRVNSGKSTLVGALVTGVPDDGSGKARSFLLKHPQEITKGQTADIHLAFMGFTADGECVHVENPLGKEETALALDRSTKIVTFFDAPGHEEFSKTMIRSILGADAQYGMILVPGPDEAELIVNEEARTGIRRLDDITREHMILMAGNSLPFIVVLSMADRTTNTETELVLDVIRVTLKEIGRIPVNVRSEDEMPPVLREIPHGVIVPIVPVSAVDKGSLELLTELLGGLPTNHSTTDISQPARAYVDRVYRGIRGTNVVVTGTVNQGLFKKGQSVLIGPDDDGKMLEGRLFSIEMFKNRVASVKAGDLFGFDLKDIDKHRVRRGQLVADSDTSYIGCRVFEANIVVTRHPTKISVGYTPVMQCHTIQQPVVLRLIYDNDFLAVGDFARVRLQFLLRPESVQVGDKIVLREANTRAIGTIVETSG